MHSKTQKASYNIDYIVPDLFDFEKMIEKRSKPRKEEILLIVKNIVLTKTWFVDSNF